MGQSVRAVARLTGARKNTVAKLLVDAGHACATYLLIFCAAHNK
jgi:hypothetical protein